MKVTDYIKNANQTLFSFEILPPLKGKSIQSIYDGIDPLMEFNPKFVNVTYHREEYIYKEKDNGLLEKVSIRKRPGTVGICAAIMNKYKVDAVPHLICGGFSKEETENALIDLQFLGIDNVLALRGDPIKTENTFILCLIAGDKKASLNKIKKELNIKDCSMATAEEVKDVTGYTIGGVSPLGHLNKIDIYVDNSLKRFN